LTRHWLISQTELLTDSISSPLMSNKCSNKGISFSSPPDLFSELWTKLVFWCSRNYLMAAGSPSGSDRDVSPLGIVQGHAYSILDVFEVDGSKLLQLRNPWGDETEWKGAWGDKSTEWNERRRRIIYDRM